MVRWVVPHQMYQSPKRAFSVLLLGMVSVMSLVAVSGMGLAMVREVRARKASKEVVRKSEMEVSLWIW